jgi:alpha-galactosidase
MPPLSATSGDRRMPRGEAWRRWCAALLLVTAGGMSSAAESRPGWDSIEPWTAPFLDSLVESLPFSFRVEGQSSRDVLPRWKRSTAVEDTNDGRRVSLKFVDPETGLEARVEAVIYRDFPAVEWVLWLKNGGARRTPLLEDVQALDATLPTSAETDPNLQLHYNRGTNVTAAHLPGPEDFQPARAVVRAGERRRFVPYGGRPSDTVMPFFNLSGDAGHSGLFLAIGWTGEWAATFARDDAGATSLVAGIRRMRASLEPGEEIRTPAILVMTWRGSGVADGHNQFRRLLLHHYTPRLDGKPVVPPISAGPHAAIAFERTTEANLLRCIENIALHGLPVDNFWLDAGWYSCPQQPSGWDKTTGSWTPDPTRFPRGLRPIADAAKRHGMDFLVWFEPERVMPGTWLADNHPEWLLAPADLLPERRYQSDDKFRLLDFGNSATLAWAKDYFSAFVREQGVSIFRMDCNLHPVLYWQNDEPPHRVGMRETRHVMGLYEFWDGLVAENPGLKLDVCAGTGSRIDFEVMRRAMNLTRADGAWWMPVPDQAKTLGHAPWTPRTGIGAVSDAAYDFRSGMGAVFCANFNYLGDDEAAWDRWKSLLQTVNDLREIYGGDFYALTEWSLAEEDIAAWQYHRPDLGKAVVQVFRRSRATMPPEGYRFRLAGLDPAATYTVTDLDAADKPVQRSGTDLMNDGLFVILPQQPQAAIITVERDELRAPPRP